MTEPVIRAMGGIHPVRPGPRLRILPGNGQEDSCAGSFACSFGTEVSSVTHGYKVKIACMGMRDPSGAMEVED